MTVIYVSDVLELNRKIRELNAHNFDEIEWMHDDDSPFEVSDVIKGSFKLTGLSNRDFPGLFLMDQIKQQPMDRPKVGMSYRIKQGQFKDMTCLNCGLYTMVAGRSWTECSSHECMSYSIRRERDKLPYDDNVYATLIDDREVLIHIAEFYDLSDDEELND